MWRVNYGNNNDSHPLHKKLNNPNTMSSSLAQIQTPASYGYLLRDFLASVNQHSSNKSEKNKRGDIDIEEMSMGSTRWTPTPEQLYALEKIYQSGTRNPSATQIQQVAARLRRFGKIEGKNVFYWFQNHKARERQKRRRQQLQNSLSPDEHLQIKRQSLGLRTCFEVGQTKNWFTPSDCSAISEESAVSSLASADQVAKGKIEEKVQFDDRGLQLELSIVTGTATNHAVDHKAQKHKKIWMPPYRDTIKATDEERKCRKLELFPNWIGDHDDQYQISDGSNVEDPSEMEPVTLSRKFTPTNFFEFLPLNINKQ